MQYRKFSIFSQRDGKLPLPQWNQDNYPVITIYDASPHNNQLMQGIMLVWWVILGILVKNGGNTFFCLLEIATARQPEQCEIINFEDFGLLTLIFTFDYAATSHMTTLPMSVCPYDIYFKEVTCETWHTLWPKPF